MGLVVGSSQSSLSRTVWQLHASHFNVPSTEQASLAPKNAVTAGSQFPQPQLSLLTPKQHEALLRNRTLLLAVVGNVSNSQDACFHSGRRFHQWTQGHGETILNSAQLLPKNPKKLECQEVRFKHTFPNDSIFSSKTFHWELGAADWELAWSPPSFPGMWLSVSNLQADETIKAKTHSTIRTPATVSAYPQVPPRGEERRRGRAYSALVLFSLPRLGQKSSKTLGQGQGRPG